MRQFLSNHRQKLILFMTTFLFYLFISANVPYMQDDWNWGIDAGIHSFITADQNSRYAGNLTILLLTRSVWLKNVAMAAVFAAIPFIMLQVADMKNDRNFIVIYLLANVLILCMPQAIWRQTYGWVSGFANFVMSLPVVCGHTWMINTYLFGQRSATSPVKPVWLSLVFVLSFIGQLFIENIAVYFAAVYACALVISYIRDHKFHPCLLVAFFGVCIGLVVMFSSSLYDTLLSTGSAYDGYRRLNIDTSAGLGGVVKRMLYVFCYWLAQAITVEFGLPTILILVSNTLLLVLKKTKFSLLLALGNLGLGTVYAIFWGIGIFAPYRYKILFAFVYYAAILFECIYLFKANATKRDRAAFIWLSVYGIVLPLVVTNFCSGRVLLASYVLASIFAIRLVCEVLEKLPIKRALTVGTAVVAVFLAVHYGSIYFSIGATNTVRMEAIQKAIEQNSGVIYLEEYEHPEYMWGQDSFVQDEETDPKWLRDFKIFYGIPSDYLIYIMDTQ